MSTQTVNRHQGERSLVDAIRRRDRAVLTLRLDEGWRTHSAEFVAGNKTAGRITLLIRRPRSASSQRNTDASSENGPPVELPRAGESIGVTFRAGHKKCMFATQVADTPSGSDGLLVTLTWPKSVERLQRRAFERVTPPRDMIIPVRFWRITSSGSDVDDRSNVRHAQLEDFSAGGMRIRTAELTDIAVGELYRCAFAPGKQGTTLVVDARLRHREASDRGRASLGFQFIGLETTPEGRKTLSRIARVVQQFQRNQHRTRTPRRTDAEAPGDTQGDAQ